MKIETAWSLNLLKPSKSISKSSQAHLEIDLTIDYKIWSPKSTAMKTKITRSLNLSPIPFKNKIISNQRIFHEIMLLVK